MGLDNQVSRSDLIKLNYQFVGVPSYPVKSFPTIIKEGYKWE